MDHSYYPSDIQFAAALDIKSRFDGDLHINNGCITVFINNDIMVDFVENIFVCKLGEHDDIISSKTFDYMSYGDGIFNYIRSL